MRQIVPGGVVGQVSGFESTAGFGSLMEMRCFFFLVLLSGCASAPDLMLESFRGSEVPPGFRVLGEVTQTVSVFNWYGEDEFEAAGLRARARMERKAAKLGAAALWFEKEPEFQAASGMILPAMDPDRRRQEVTLREVRSQYVFRAWALAVDTSSGK